ncbi:DNA-binding protein HU [Actibacterium atlanticum]|uniref:DNA-binding protein HU n=1 Tax=Actibacterium atlanticum TaxID=1461693 RepID=A0A058ZR15_9RHOB|nr:HU family DNA-binding protein [Actibacterium atlanticum]KCV83256.1 DNA-binding protein HU [Actibacterium atlanticum]
MFLRKTRAATTTAADAEIETEITPETAVDDTVATPDFEMDEEPTVFLRKKDLVDRAVERSGLKKRDVKPAIEAALAVLGESIEAGEGLNLPPFGKVKVVKRKELDRGSVLIARIRRSEQAEKTDHDMPLAEAAE